MTALISRDELKAAIDEGVVTVVDTLGPAYFRQQHLPGAVNLVEDDVDERAAELLPDLDAAIVTYCAGPSCANSERVAKLLMDRGYRNVRKYREGIQDWVEAGLSTDTLPVD